MAQQKKYEKPVVIPLGDVVRGAGACQNGPSQISGSKCQDGGAALGSKCQNGGVATGRKCQAGGNPK